MPDGDLVRLRICVDEHKIFEFIVSESQAVAFGAAVSASALHAHLHAVDERASGAVGQPPRWPSTAGGAPDLQYPSPPQEERAP
jgi:hypothetical protein